MLSQLREPLVLKMKKCVPDDEGGWEEKEAGTLLVWAALGPLPSSQSQKLKPLEAFSTTAFPAGERFNVVIREGPGPALLEIAEMIWNTRTLIPLSQPSPLEKNRGFLSFQALLLPQKEGNA